MTALAPRVSRGIDTVMIIIREQLVEGWDGKEEEEEKYS
jgi:hypothetical protein